MATLFFITKSHRFPNNMISYMESRFPDIEKEYFVVDRRKKVQLPEAANVHRILSYVEFLKNRSLVRLIHSADGIVVSGVFIMQYVFPIYGKNVLRKIYWQFWGGDYEKFCGRKRLTRKLRAEKWIIARNLQEARGTILLTRQEFDIFQKIFPEVVKKKVYYAIVPSGADDEEMIRRIRSERTRQRNDQNLLIQTGSAVEEAGMVSSEKENMNRRIVIGNSSTDSNRHLELFEKIKHLDLINVDLYCPLSYGEKEYRDEVIKQGYELFGNHFHPLTEYMKYEEYVKFLCTCDVGIYYNNRQQALGNINRMLDLGKKVYLPVMLRDYCATYGYITYAVEDIVHSSIRDLLDFPIESVEHNIDCIEARTQDIYESWRSIFEDMKAIKEHNITYRCPNS